MLRNVDNLIVQAGFHLLPSSQHLLSPLTWSENCWFFLCVYCVIFWSSARDGNGSATIISSLSTDHLFAGSERLVGCFSKLVLRNCSLTPVFAAGSAGMQVVVLSK